MAADSFRNIGRKLRKLGRMGPAIMAAGMRVGAEEIATDIRSSRPGRGVPKDEGILSASIGVRGPSAGGVIEIYAGGSAAPYAVIQHERLDFNHRLGEARYLIRGVERWRPNGSSARRAWEEAFAAATVTVRTSV